MDAATFQTEVMKNERLLYRISWNMLGTNEDCADAVQETLLKAWANRETLRDVQAFRPWLTRILANTCKSMLRKRKMIRFVPMEEAPEAFEPDLTSPPPFREAMSTLSPDQRTVAMLFYLEGYPIREISDMLDLPSGTVKSRLMYARKHLQTVLAEEWED